METGTQTDFIYNSIYVKNDVLEAFYDNYLEYNGFVKDILNTLVPKDDILHWTEKESTAEHSKKNEIFRKPNRRSEKGKPGSERNINIKAWYWRKQYS